MMNTQILSESALRQLPVQPRNGEIIAVWCMDAEMLKGQSRLVMPEQEPGGRSFTAWGYWSSLLPQVSG